MSDSLDGFDVEVARDLRGRSHEPWLRRIGLLAVVVVPLLALANTFGQRAVDVTTTTPMATMVVHGPVDVRGGLLYDVHIYVSATTRIPNASLVFNHSWLDGMSLNTIEPSPSSETSTHRNLVFGLGSIAAGDTYELHLQYQVDPTSVGRRQQTVVLRAGPQVVATVSRHLMIWP